MANSFEIEKASSPSHRPARKQIHGLTGLRGLAAMWVFLFHAQYGMDLPVLKLGYLGVDIFFILSGFILSHAHGGRAWTTFVYCEFIAKRVIRIFPLHLFALLIFLLVISVVPGLHQVPGKGQLTWLSFVASFFLVQNWGFDISTAWNGPSWSLSAEWLGSLSFPLFLMLAGKVKTPRSALIGIVAILAVFWVVLLLSHNPNPGVMGRPGVIRLACEFLAGTLLYRAYASGYEVTPLIGGLAFAAVLIGVLTPSCAMLAVFGIPVFLLLAASSGTRTSKILRTRLMRYLGEISYSLYLMHFTILMVAHRAHEGVQLHGAQVVAWAIGVFVATFVISTLTYSWIERPAMTAGRIYMSGKAAQRVLVQKSVVSVNISGQTEEISNL